MAGARGSSEVGLVVSKPLPEPPFSPVQVHERVAEGGWGSHSWL